LVQAVQQLLAETGIMVQIHHLVLMQLLQLVVVVVAVLI